MDLRAVQKPLKEHYREDPATSRITLVARGGQGKTPVACSVDLGRTIYEAQAHPGVGGAGTAACSGDLLLGALAACAQLTCQMVATSMEIPVESVEVTAEGDLDLSARDQPRGPRGLRGDSPSLRHRRADRDRGTACGSAREDGAVLRRPTNAGESAADRNDVGLRNREVGTCRDT